MKIKNILCGLFVVLFFFPQAQAQSIHYTYEGKAFRVFDGDSFLLRKTNGKVIDIRMLGVDAPEKGQPYSAKATEALEQMILNQVLEVEVRDVDPHGRDVALIYVQGLEVNFAMVEKGWAWVNRPFIHNLYKNERLDYLEAQNQAQTLGIGLWADRKKPVAPWDHRRKNRKKKN